MYYKLREDLQLRGWKLLPTGVVRKLSDDVEFLPPEVFRAIQKACNSVAKNSALFSAEEKKILAELSAHGVLEETETPVPLTKEQQYRVYPNRFLYGVQWAITGNCNCRCRHCYMSAPTGKIGEMPLDKCLEVVKQMEAAGVRKVTLTGGEALIRKDFFTIVDALLEADILVGTVMSNGLLVNERILAEFEKRGIKPSFSMSFDGIGCHDWLRGVPGAENAVRNAFLLCKERGFPTDAEYCLHKGNLHVLRDSIKLLGELGCQYLKVNRLSLEGEGLGIADYAITQEEEFQTYLDYIPHYYEDGEPLTLTLSGFWNSLGGKPGTIGFVKNEEHEDCSNYCLCGHARNYMYITAEGAMVPCIPMGSKEGGRSHFPNIAETSIAEALEDDSPYMKFINMRLSEYFAHNPGCAVCEYKNRCAGGCRGHVAGKGGGDDLLGRDEVTCAFFHQGWYEKLQETMKKIGKEQKVKE